MDQATNLVEGSFVMHKITNTISRLKILRVFEASTLENPTNNQLSYAFWRDLRPATKSEIIMAGFRLTPIRPMQRKN